MGTPAFVPPLLRYGVFELLLVQPLVGGFWRAPEKPWKGPWPPEHGASVGVWESSDRSLRARLEREPTGCRAPSGAAAPVDLRAVAVPIQAFNHRRSWQRAYAAASASQDLSSASSSTSAVCAPDTP